MKVNASELRWKLGHYLNQAEQGMQVDITRSGKHVASLVPAVQAPLLPIAERCLFGAHSYDGIDSSPQRFTSFEARVSRKLDIIQWFRSWGSPWSDSLELLNFAKQKGYKPLITWQPKNRVLWDIVSGQHNADIDAWAIAIRDSNYPVYLRPFPEMNLDEPAITWQGEPVWLIAAWRHTVNRFKQLGAHNVKWVWSPNHIDIPNEPGNRLEDYYPGSSFVDVLAVDGYNFGDTFSNGVPLHVWTSFEDVFSTVYQRLSKLDADLPIWITETACAEDATHDKAKWVRDMFASRQFPNLEAVVWFDENKERDWRVDSSSATQAAFKDIFGPVIV